MSVDPNLAKPRAAAAAARAARGVAVHRDWRPRLAGRRGRRVSRPALQSWRPVTLAGLGIGVLGTSIFVLQLAAARRGARGAQTGLENYLDHK